MYVISIYKSLVFYSPCLLCTKKVHLLFSVEILGRPREVPEEKHLVVHARVTLIPSGSAAGDQVRKLLSKASDSK